ncbi:hypothetical protein MKK75_18020 [Methylobacterium sp. J-030]|uniref:hypothetical protein n=1 Tax=Methylobacterium sp. J-030 TaxID=2836627 RepID=UPI001FBA21A0|nr:hypothetical protein [Methylobacterium sp. J-030]MCJ2070664.1 hypothetical protein [Methylobacterium sp. J-030]
MTQTTTTEPVRSPSASDPTRGLLEGAAFVLLCLWTRTTPVRLRDQLSPEVGSCATLGF